MMGGPQGGHFDPHGGHESDESGEYDRLGFDPVSNHHREYSFLL